MAKQVMRTQVIEIDSSFGIALPKEVLDKLRVNEGDKVYFVETPEGVLLTPRDPDFGVAIQAAESFMEKYPDALTKPAKS